MIRVDYINALHVMRVVMYIILYVSMIIWKDKRLVRRRWDICRLWNMLYVNLAMQMIYAIGTLVAMVEGMERTKE